MSSGPDPDAERETRAAATLLDGGTGTELSRRGADTAPPLWSAGPLADEPGAAGPDLVTAVHRAYLEAGCEVLTTCTFRTHERNLARAGRSGESERLNARAVACCEEAIASSGRPRESVRVAGSLAPLEDCFRPDLVPGDAELAEEHGRQARSLAAAGVDLLLVETMACRREAEAATHAALATGLPVWCSFVSDGSGLLLSGEQLNEAAVAVEAAGVAAVLVNCVPVIAMRRDVVVLRRAVSVPVGACGNIGHASDVSGWRVELMLEPEVFATHAMACVEAGATLVGGCCGTEPRHLRALAARLGRRRPWPGRAARDVIPP